MNTKTAAQIARAVSTSPRVKSAVIVYLTTDRASTTGLVRSNHALATLREAGVARSVQRRAQAAA